MPTNLFIPGPTEISVNTAGSFVTLGYSDNDNLPAVQFTDNHHEVKTVIGGAVPVELVLTGTSARISVALVKWDSAVLSGLLAKQRGTYNSAAVGTTMVAGVKTFGVRIESIATGQAFEFTRCYLQPDGYGDSQWGNRERVLTLAFSAIPNGSNILYTLVDS
jgi:hypothetical protein